MNGHVTKTGELEGGTAAGDAADEPSEYYMLLEPDAEEEDSLYLAGEHVLGEGELSHLSVMQILFRAAYLTVFAAGTATYVAGVVLFPSHRTGWWLLLAGGASMLVLMCISLVIDRHNLTSMVFTCQR